MLTKGSTAIEAGPVRALGRATAAAGDPVAVRASAFPVHVAIEYQHPDCHDQQAADHQVELARGRRW